MHVVSSKVSLGERDENGLTELRRADKLEDEVKESVMSFRGEFE